jgi:tRNA threonylcarbamoyladenosine biosynthesis protein TsaB
MQAPYILAIETSTRVCSVSLFSGNDVIDTKSITEQNAHASHLTLLIENVLTGSGIDFKQLNAIAVSKGPGSYTGLRIGVSAAKGLCYALDIPLISVNTLQSMAKGMRAFHKEPEDNLLYCPMIDARRMEVYCAIFDQKGNEIRKTRAEIIDKHSFSDYLSNNKLVFAGDGAEKCKSVLADNENTVFPDRFEISAETLAETAFQKYTDKQFEDTAYFEPYYLKDFIAGKPKVKGLH